MSQPVWSLSVDLQTKTATFQSGLSDAARSARNAFTDIKQGAEGMSDGVSYNMTEARHGVMLLGEEFGVKMPRALVSFISSLGPVSAAMEAAFPFLAIIVGATLLLEHLAKLREAGEKLTESQVTFGTAAANALNSLDEKLLTAGIKADELNNNHLGALHKQLELIDRQSMAELVQSFGVVSKAADIVFEQLKTSWYQFDSGSAGAKSSLEKFRAEYDSLLAQGKNTEATELLDQKIARERQILALQKEASTYRTYQDPGYKANVEARIAVQKAGTTYDEKAIASQKILVQALEAQVQVQQRVNSLKGLEKTNAVQTTDNKIGADQDKAWRIQAEAQKQALDVEQKQWEENYKAAVSALQENEKAKIEATETGSQERLHAIDAAIKEEEAKGLQETGFYKGLLTTRVSLVRQMADEEDKLKAEAGKEAAEHALKMGELSVAAQRDKDQLTLSAMRNSEQQRLAFAVQSADAEYAAKKQALEKEGSSLDKSKGDYDNKLKALNDRELELAKAHANKIAQIKMQAEEATNARLLSAAKRRDDAIAGSLTSTIMRQQSFSKAMLSLGDQVAAGTIQNALKSILADDMTKPHDAAKAARKAFNAGMEFPFPVNLVMAPALGAMAFASVMAFEKGGIVPGIGNQDNVHAMLTPGEAVLPKKMVENLSHATGNSKSGDTHVHIHSSPTVHALDSEGMSRVLDKHSDTLAQHFNNHLRKMNR